jgi:hypothetical protein
MCWAERTASMQIIYLEPGMDRISLQPCDANPTDLIVHLVLDEEGGRRFYRETDETAGDRDTIVENILRGVYLRPIRVIEVDLARGLTKDVTMDVASSVLERARTQERSLSVAAERFVEAVLGRNASIRVFD